MYLAAEFGCRITNKQTLYTHNYLYRSMFSTKPTNNMKTHFSTDISPPLFFRTTLTGDSSIMANEASDWSIMIQLSSDWPMKPADNPVKLGKSTLKF